MSRWDLPETVTLQQTPSKGLGLFASTCQLPGAQVFTDAPLFAVQHTGNKRVVRACANCCAFVGCISAQLEGLFNEERFAPVLAAAAAPVAAWEADMLRNLGVDAGTPLTVRCSQGCGEMYCSQQCRDTHFGCSHNLFCTGPIESEDHPLLKFKYLALEHADTLLLAGEVFAFLINRAKAAGGGADVTRKLMTELLGFHHAPFRDACRAPPDRAKDAEFVHNLEQMLAEAATHLHAAWEPYAPAEVSALFEGGSAFLSEVMGLFEYNNIDVDVPSPVGPLLAAKGQALLAAAQAGDAQAAAELEVLARLLREKELVMQCIVPEETTGIFGDDPEPGTEGSAGAGAVDMLMEDPEVVDEELDEQVAEAAMAEARQRVDAMSLAQLLEAPWPSMHGIALFATVARLNHSCAPNVRIDFPANSACLVAQALEPIEVGAELCISYIRQDADVQVRRKRLLEYGFVCSCPLCVKEDSGATRRAQRRLK